MELVRKAKERKQSGKIKDKKVGDTVGNKEAKQAQGRRKERTTKKERGRQMS